MPTGRWHITEIKNKFSRFFRRTSKHARCRAPRFKRGVPKAERGRSFGRAKRACLVSRRNWLIGKRPRSQDGDEIFHRTFVTENIKA